MTGHLALVAEDDTSMLAIYQHVLDIAGFDVLVAQDGAVAIELLGQNSPDIAFIDIRLPLIDGLEILDYIHNSPHLDNMRVIVISADKNAEQFTRHLSRVEFLLKPVYPAAIRDLIMAM